MLLGTYSVNNSMLDLAVLIFMGVLGYGLRKLKFDVAPMILAVVLGPLMERSFRQSLFMSSGNLPIFVERPVCLALLLVLAAIIVVPPIWRIVKGRRKPAAA